MRPFVYFCCTHVTIPLQGASQTFECGGLWRCRRLVRCAARAANHHTWWDCERRRPVTAGQIVSHDVHFLMAFHSNTCRAYSVFALDTFIPLFSKASLHCPSSISSTSFSFAHSINHPRTSSAKVLLFWCFPSLNPSWWQTRKGWKRILGGGQLPLQTVRFSMQHISMQLSIGGTSHVLHQAVVLSGTPCLACRPANTVLPSGVCRIYLCCICLSATIASVVDFPFTNQNCSSLMLTMFLIRLSCILIGVNITAFGRKLTLFSAIPLSRVFSS